MASQNTVETRPASAPAGSRRQRRFSILILVGLAFFGGVAAWRGYPQLAAPILGLPAAFEVLRRVTERESTLSSGTKAYTNRNTVRWRGILVAVLVLFIFSLGYLTSVIAYAVGQPDVWLEMTSADLSSSVDVNLHWKNLKVGQQPSVFVYSASDRKYYPAPCGVASESGTQPCRIDVGVGGDRGKAFNLLPVLLTEDGEAAIRKYQSDLTSAGMKEPPEGTSLFAGKTVVRKD